MKIAFAQLSPVHGDTPATVALVAEAARAAAADGARLIVFPECFLTGGSFDDRAALLQAAVDIERGDLAPILLAAREADIHVVVGFYQKSGPQALNTAALIGPEASSACITRCTCRS